MMNKLIIFAITIAAAVSCGNPSSKPQNSEAQPTTEQNKKSVFMPAIPPTTVVGEELRDYMAEHYWDNLDFSDSTFIKKLDSTEIFGAFVGYIGNYLDPNDPAPMDSLMRKIAANNFSLRYFASMARQALYDPNSMVRSDVLYIPVLNHIIHSPWYTNDEKIAPRAELHLASQNQVGSRANDFEFTLANGSTSHLYKIKADYTILFIANPECPMCKHLSEELSSSPMVNELVENGTVKILKLYTDEDLTAWKNELSHVPARWINGYDKQQTIMNERLYSLRAIPSLYLLDRNKKVLIKDGVDIEAIEMIIDQQS